PRLTLLAEGLFGEQMKRILELESAAARIFSGWSWKSSVRATLRISTSLMFALTSYIPYVGGRRITLSFPGLQKARYSRSMASSEPFPRKIWFVRTVLIFEISVFKAL